MRKKIIIFILWIVLLLGLCLVYLNIKDAEAGEGDVTIECINTANDADCFVIRQDGVCAIIDTGEKSDAEKILAHLKSAGISRINLLILTHNDSDHIGSSLDLVNEIPVDKVVETPYGESNDTINELNSYLLENGTKVVYPSHNTKMSIGDIKFIIYPPNKTGYKKENNSSLAILVNHRSVNCLFTGDAQKKRITELLLVDWPNLNMLKVPHHGKACSLTDELFEKTVPEYAVVTSDSADTEIVNIAGKLGTELVYTRNGNYSFISNGESLILQEE